MDHRERLERIRAGNAGSYRDFEDEAVGPSPALPDNPWLAVWSRPRATVRAIVDADPGYRVLLLASLDGFARALSRSMTRGWGDLLPWPMLVGLCAVVGPAAALASLYLGAALLRRLGNALGGRATSAEVRAALAWGAVPRVAMLLPLAGVVAVLGGEAFSADRPTLRANPKLAGSFLQANLANLALLIWSVVLTFRALVEVFRMAAWRVLVAVVAGGALFAGTVALTAFAVLASGVLGDFGRPRPAMPVAAPAQPPAAPTPAPKRSMRPQPWLGPAAAAIREEGLRVDGRVVGEGPEGPEMELSIGKDGPGGNDHALRHLADAAGLRALRFHLAYPLTDAGLAHVGRVGGLRELSFRGPEITDVGFGQLRGLARLRKLDVARTAVASSGLEALSGMADLEELSFWECDELPDAALRNLASLSKLRSLTFIDCSRLDGRGLADLRGLPALATLRFSDARISDAGLEALRGLPALRELNLGCTGLDDDRLALLAGLETVEVLDVGTFNRIEGPGLAHLRGLPRLRELSLAGMPVGDAAVGPLSGLAGLRRLDLGGTDISRPALGRLGEALPDAEIVHPHGPALPAGRGRGGDRL